MSFFVKNRFQRESVISSSSSLSKDSVDSQSSNPVGNEIENNQSKEKTSCSDCLLFFGPLILFVILLIIGIVVFIITQQQIPQHQNNDKFSHGLSCFIEKNFQLRDPFFYKEDYVPLSCPFVTWKSQSAFIYNQLKCGLHCSSVFHIYYGNSLFPMKVGENLSGHDIINSPKIKFNYGFLSKIPTKSFVLIFVNPKYLKMFSNMAALQWIRYYSSSLDEEEDICCYKDASYAQTASFEFIFLLYATNLSRMVLRAETVCHRIPDFFN